MVALEADAPLARQSEHGGVIEEVLECHHRLENRPQIIGTGEAGSSQSPHGIHVERQAAFSELKPRHFASPESADELLVHVSKRNRRRPDSVDGGLHGLRLEHKDCNFGLFGAQAEGEGVPSVVSQDGEVGGEVHGGGGEGEAVDAGGREIQEAKEL